MCNKHNIKKAIKEDQVSDVQEVPDSIKNTGNASKEEMQSIEDQYHYLRVMGNLDQDEMEVFENDSRGFILGNQHAFDEMEDRLLSCLGFLLDQPACYSGTDEEIDEWATMGAYLYHTMDCLMDQGPTVLEDIPERHQEAFCVGYQNGLYEIADFIEECICDHFNQESEEEVA
jgi:hypothetical protein